MKSELILGVYVVGIRNIATADSFNAMKGLCPVGDADASARECLKAVI